MSSRWKNHGQHLEHILKNNALQCSKTFWILMSVSRRLKTIRRIDVWRGREVDPFLSAVDGGTDAFVGLHAPPCRTS